MKTNSEIVEILRNVAAAHKIKKVNRFRVVAYENAADSIEQLPVQVYDLWKKGKLGEVSGLGETLTGNLAEYFKTGKSKNFDDALSGISPAVFELMKVPGLGPLKAYRLSVKFNLENAETAASELEKHAANGEIADLEGFGKKSQEALLTAIKQYGKTRALPGRIAYAQAEPVARELITYMKKNKFVKRIDAMGSLRRREATIGDIDIAVAAEKGREEGILRYFLAYPKLESVINAGATKASIRVAPNLRVDFRVQDEKTYGTMLQYFTGSKAHNIKLREYALTKGYSLNEYGLKNVANPEEPLKVFPTEESLYGFLGLEYIKPELRKGAEEIENAKMRS